MNGLKQSHSLTMMVLQLDQSNNGPLELEEQFTLGQRIHQCLIMTDFKMCQNFWELLQQSQQDPLLNQFQIQEGHLN